MIRRSFQGLQVPFGTFVLRPAQRPFGPTNCTFFGHRALLLFSRKLQVLLLRPQNVPATLEGAATAASEVTARSCNAPGRCNLLLLRPQNAPATLLEGATGASEATERSCNALRRCNLSSMRPVEPFRPTATPIFASQSHPRALKQSGLEI